MLFSQLQSYHVQPEPPVAVRQQTGPRTQQARPEADQILGLNRPRARTAQRTAGAVAELYLCDDEHGTSALNYWQVSK
jgi:hypothetical protein